MSARTLARSPVGGRNRTTEVDWQTYHRLYDERHGAYLAHDSWHRSATNLKYRGSDEYGVYPGEEGILNRVIAGLRAHRRPRHPARVHHLSRRGEYYAYHEVPTAGERFYDEWPSRCPACGSTGAYQGEK